MKKISYLLLLLATIMIIPFGVFAEGEEEVPAEEVTTIGAVSDKVNVYLFRGDGCPHCQEAEEWFESIQGEYGALFQVIDYEVWYNSDNASFMDEVAKAREEEVGGVPYIIIGNKSWNGFTTDFGTEMIEQIKSEYEQAPESRYDIVKLLPELAEKATSSNTTQSRVAEENNGSDVGALLLVLIITGAVCFGVYKARKASN